MLDRLLDTTIRRPPMYYVGVLRDDQRDCAAAMEAKVYAQWDASESAPPKRRPADPVSEPTLEFLSWVNGAPVFPETALQQFSEGSEAYPGTSGRSRRPTSVRATGRPDYTIDGGVQPLDTTRLVDKEHMAESAFSVTRLGLITPSVLNVFQCGAQESGQNCCFVFDRTNILLI